MVERDAAGRRRGKKIYEVTTAFLDTNGTETIRAWFTADQVSPAVLRGAIKKLSAEKASLLKALYAELTGSGRGVDLTSERTVIADRRGDKGPSVVTFVVDTSGERGLWKITPTDSGFLVTKDVAPAPARRQRKAKATPVAAEAAAVARAAA